MNNEYSRRTVLQIFGSTASLSLAGCAALAENDETQPTTDASLPIFVYNLDNSPHNVNIQISGTSEAESFTGSEKVSPEAIEKVTEVGTDDFYLKARVEDVKNGMDATGPARGESDFSEDGYLVVVHEEVKNGSRVEIKPLHPGDAATMSG